MVHSAEMPASTCFEVTIENQIAHIQLNRPEAMNAMNRAFWNELPVLVNDINIQSRARVIVISSTGKHFSAGMDLAVFASGGTVSSSQGDRETRNESFRHHVHSLQDTFSCLEKARVPVLVAIQGGCIGGAVDFVSACDIRWATADAFFCIQEINLAMTADVGTFPRLCKLLPDGWLRELAYTGRRLPAALAKQLGLVNDVFDSHETMLAHVMDVAREIASKAPLAITGSKAMINYARDHTIADSLDYIALWQTGMFSPPQMAEAFRAKQTGDAAQFPDLLAIKRGM